MSRYRTRAAYIGYDEDGDLSMTADEIWEDDRAPEPTGLVDQHGQEIYRVRETVPFGFQGQREKG